MKTLPLALSLGLLAATFSFGENESFRIADDGAWTWFNDPRALFHNGTLYVGFVRMADGRSCLNAVDTDKRTFTTVFSSDFAQKDDHNNPGLLSMNNGHLLAMMARHDRDKHIEYRISKSTAPTTSGDWGEAVKLEGFPHISYQNPYQLSADADRIYSFGRSVTWNPSVRISDDNGKTWGPLKHVISAGKRFGEKRPYAKYSSNGKDRVDILYTDGHPDSVKCSLYHIYLDPLRDAIRRTDGSIIKPFSASPLDHDNAKGGGEERGSLIYTYSETPNTDYTTGSIPFGRAWCWEITQDKNGYPVCVFVVQTRGSGKERATAFRHDRLYYYYARYTPETGWRKQFIAQAGRPLYHSQRYYAGGIALDPANPDVVYLSTNAARPFETAAIGEEGVPLAKNERYEIYRGVLNDPEKMTFDWSPVTRDSAKDNLRPYVPRFSPYKKSLVYFSGDYIEFTEFQTEVRGIFTNE